MGQNWDICQEYIVGVICEEEADIKKGLVVA